MKYRWILLLALVTGISCSSSTAPGDAEGRNDPDQEEWISLFNGEDLSGWLPKITGYELNENFADTFRVEDGLFQVRYDGYENFEGRFGHIFYDQSFSYYRLRVVYRFVGEQVPGGPDWALRNSGIMIHCQPPETMSKDQDFPISIEVQLLGGAESGDRPTANLCTPGTNVVMDGELVTQHCVQSSSETFRGDQWVTSEVLVLGSERMTHYINGEEVLTYEQPQIGGGQVNNHLEEIKQDGTILDAGYISLQSESHPIDFQSVELLPLVGCTDPDALNYKSYYEKSEDSDCRYE